MKSHNSNIKIKKNLLFKVLKEEIKKELLKEGILRIQDYISNENLKLIEDTFRNLLNTYLTSDREESLYWNVEKFEFINVAGEEEVVDLMLSVGRPPRGMEGAVAYLDARPSIGYYHLAMCVLNKEDYDIEDGIDTMINHELIHLIDSKYFKRKDRKKAYLARREEILAFSSQIYKQVVDFLNSEDEQDKDYLNILLNLYKDGAIKQLQLFKAILKTSQQLGAIGKDPRFIKSIMHQHTMKDKQPYLKHLYKKLWPLILDKLEEV